MLTLTGATAASIAGVSGTAAAEWRNGPAEEREDWSVVESPISQTIYSVAPTTRGPTAVAGKGYVIARRDGEWEVLLDRGPAASSNTLYAADVTSDGKRVWFAGSSGALGFYDVDEGKKHDYTAPLGKTSTWEAITVAGKKGSEKILVANGSGEVLPGYITDHNPEWGWVVKPGGSGSTISALGASADGIGYAVNTSGSVFKTTDDDGWERIGIENAQVKFYGIAATESNLFVPGGGGLVYRYNKSANNWTPLGVGTGALRGIGQEGDEMVVAGDGGSIYIRDGPNRWELSRARTSQTLNAIALGNDLDVIVGKNVILESPAADNEGDSGGGSDGGSGGGSDGGSGSTS
jgi:uncharacterized membrane protein YgcG